MTNHIPDEQGFTELVDPSVPRVDLVDLPANGAPGWLLMKQDAQAGLMSPEAIRDLIGKAADEPPPAAQDTVTMSGSPGAIAKLIHAAAVRQVAKAKYDTADRKRMAGHEAMDDGSYPIADREDLTDAIHAVGRGGADHDAIRRHIAARAKALGASSEIPDDWNKDGSLKGDVAKEATDMDDDALDATTALAEPGSDAPGMPTDPGSPAWEAIDAATARKWTAILARAQNAIGMLADREMLESASADPDDAENAFDLDDACCAIDYAISVLAPYAVAEQAEADCCDDMAMVGKALADVDTTALDTIEALAPIAKAGRVLSTANEAAIRGAVESLQKVLASLPAAPTTEEGGRPVAKTANQEADMPQATTSAEATAASGQEPAMGVREPEPKPAAGNAAAGMAKADGEKTPMVVVYDQKGRLIGIADPADITPVANAEADADDMDDAAPADDAAPPDSTSETPDLTPAPSDEAGTPADAVTDDDVTKAHSTSAPDTPDMFTSSLLEMVKSALTDHSATTAAQIATTGDAVLELANVVETLKGQIKVLEEQPAQPKVFTNGAVPPRDVRGMDHGTVPVDVTKARELKKTLYRGTPAEQNAAFGEMQQMAVDKLAAIQGR